METKRNINENLNGMYSASHNIALDTTTSVTLCTHGQSLYITYIHIFMANAWGSNRLVLLVQLRVPIKFLCYKGPM